MKLIISNTNENDFRPQPGDITPEEMTQSALAAIRRTPELLQCRVDSLLEALTLCMEAGLEPDGRNAHLLAQGDAARLVFDWKGLVALGRRCGVEAIHADVVCGRDDFGVSYEGGTKLTHHVDYQIPRGEAYAVYCYYVIDGEPDVEVMTREEVERERAAELAGCLDNSALAQLWEQDWPGMAKRTVVTRATQRWPVPAIFSISARATSPGGDTGDAPSDEAAPQGRTGTQAATPLETLRQFMQAREISEASMLDNLKEEGRIADYVTRISDVPAPVIEDVVASWMDMMEEEGTI